MKTQMQQTIETVHGDHNYITTENISAAVLPVFGIDAACKIVDGDSAVIIERINAGPYHRYFSYRAKVESTGHILIGETRLTYAIEAALTHWRNIGWKTYGTPAIWRIAVIRALTFHFKRFSSKK